ncbi:MAG: enoyl-CoA hydratase/isomerase family protein [Polyangiaceae bacterium]
MLRKTRTGSILEVTLDRPDARNALSLALLHELAEAIRTAEHDGTRVLVLTGSGQVFASGGDLKELAGHETEEMAQKLLVAGRNVTATLETSRVVSIAAIQGPAVGGGAELALACDLRVIDAEAHLCFRHVRLGVTPAWGSLRRLVAAVGTAQAFAWLALAANVRATEAYERGLVSTVAPSGESLQVARIFAADLLKGSPSALAQLKASLFASSGAQALDDIERDAFVRSWCSPDHKEAVLAHFERREPSFSAKPGTGS